MTGVILINYNQYQLTREFLDSLAKVKNAANSHVYIVDVSSRREKFSLKGYPFKHLVLEEKENQGYAYGVNVGVNHFLGLGIDKFCVINNDVQIDENFLVEVEK